MIQLFWMVSVRLPAIGKANLGPTAGQRTADLAVQLPENVQWKADNYNHLLEQPTAFYACAVALAMMGAGDGLNLYLAWGYVGLRIVHRAFHNEHRVGAIWSVPTQHAMSVGHGGERRNEFNGVTVNSLSEQLIQCPYCGKAFRC